MKYLKIIFSVLFVILVAVLLVRSCVHKREYRTISRGETLAIKKPAVSNVSARDVVRSASPRMALVLDDWGMNLALLDDVLNLQKPLTVAVIPHLKHSRDIAKKAHESGLGVILHMPMEPKSTKENLEPHTIMVTMPDTQILEYLDSAIADIPQVEGMNNHMGSAATADRRVMNVVLKELKAKNLFFLDSNVSPDTVGWKVAQELGLAHTKRDVFIDNNPKKEEVKKQIKRAIRVSLAQKRVVVIGHDKKATLEALKEMAPEIDKAGIKMVLVKELLEK